VSWAVIRRLRQTTVGRAAGPASLAQQVFDLFACEAGPAARRDRRAVRVALRAAVRAGAATLLAAGVAATDVHGDMGHIDTAPAPLGRIVVGRTATVDGATVRLADVATLEGNGADFGDVELGAAPDPGGSRRLDGVAILRKLRGAGLSDTATRYEIPANVRVARAYQDVSGDEIRGAVEREAASLLGTGEELRTVEVGGAARIPPGPYDVRVLPPSAASARTPRRRVDVELVQEGSVVATVAARLEVGVTGPIVLLRHAVARGAVLRADDLTVEERELTGLPSSVVTTLADAVGKETRAALSANAPVTLTALASPLLVRRGDVVTIVVETPGMRLSTPGEALEPGAAGAQIRVRNRKSQQEIAGQVVERGTVLVQY
jgi:flagella basal body P-ring formation protein FlgA